VGVDSDNWCWQPSLILLKCGTKSAWLVFLPPHAPCDEHMVIKPCVSIGSCTDKSRPEKMPQATRFQSKTPDGPHLGPTQ
jgi:hypothetical protein